MLSWFALKVNLRKRNLALDSLNIARFSSNLIKYSKSLSQSFRISVLSSWLQAYVAICFPKQFNCQTGLEFMHCLQNCESLFLTQIDRISNLKWRINTAVTSCLKSYYSVLRDAGRVSIRKQQQKLSRHTELKSHPANLS